MLRTLGGQCIGLVCSDFFGVRLSEVISGAFSDHNYVLFEILFLESKPKIVQWLLIGAILAHLLVTANPFLLLLPL